MMTEALPTCVAAIHAPDESETLRWMYLKGRDPTVAEKQTMEELQQFHFRAVSPPFLQDSELRFEIKWKGYPDHDCSLWGIEQVFENFSEDGIFFEMYDYWKRSGLPAEVVELFDSVTTPLPVRLCDSIVHMEHQKRRL
jgi:hypothetical protein